MLTHDLKTPVLAQVKALEFLLAGNTNNLSSEQTLLLKQVISSCKFVQEMISSIISIQKFSLSEYKLNPSEFNLKDLIENCHEELNSIAFNKNIQINANFNELKDPIIYADKMTIQRVIKNLIFNAISCGMENSTLDVVVENEQSNINFKVKNKTVKQNITQASIEKMFERYSILQSKFRQVGCGMGLYLTKKIIQSHGGNLFSIVKKENNSNCTCCEIGFNLNNRNKKINENVILMQDTTKESVT